MVTLTLTKVTCPIQDGRLYKQLREALKTERPCDVCGMPRSWHHEEWLGKPLVADGRGQVNEPGKAEYSFPKFEGRF